MKKQIKFGKLDFARILSVVLSSYCAGLLAGTIIGAGNVPLFAKIFLSVVILTGSAVVSYRMALLIDKMEKCHVRKPMENKMELEIMEACRQNKEARKNADRDREQEAEKERTAGHLEGNVLEHQ